MSVEGGAAPVGPRRRLARGAAVAGVTLVLALAPPPALGQEAFFEEGNSLYQAGDYRGALDAYLRLVEAGYESAALYYNMGNCHFKLGDLGRSILYYERAVRIDPGDEDARANLALAASLAEDEIVPMPVFLPVRVARWTVRLVPREWLVGLLAAGYLVASLSLIWRWLGRRPSAHRLGGRVAWVAAVVGLAAAANLVAADLAAGRRAEGVILADEVPVQSAPSEDRNLQVFTIHEGTKVRVDQQVGEWAEIVLADGKVGWVRVGTFETI